VARRRGWAGGQAADAGRGLALLRWDCNTLIPGPHPVPALLAATDDADILLPQLLDRGWAFLGITIHRGGGSAGAALVGCSWSSTTRLLDDLNPYAGDG
jgi:hypothetical protein